MTNAEYMYRINSDLDLIIEWIDGAGHLHTGEVTGTDTTHTTFYVRYVDNDPTTAACVPIYKASFVNPVIKHKAADLYKIWEREEEKHLNICQRCMQKIIKKVKPLL